MDYTTPFSAYLGEHRLVALDFETYFKKGAYSLSMNRVGGLDYADYVSDPRFQVLGAAVKVGDAPSAPYEAQSVEEVLGGLDLEREDTVVIAHNARFDATVLAMHYGITCKTFCTMGAARASGAARVYGGSLDELARGVLNREKDLAPAWEHLQLTGAPETLADIEELFLHAMVRTRLRKAPLADPYSAVVQYMVARYGESEMLQRIQDRIKGKTKGIESVVEMMDGMYVEDLSADQRELYFRYMNADTEAAMDLAKVLAPRMSLREGRTIMTRMSMYTAPRIQLDAELLTLSLAESKESRATLVDEAIALSGVLDLSTEDKNLYFSKGIITPETFTKFLRNGEKFSHMLLTRMGMTPPAISTVAERKAYKKALHEYILTAGAQINFDDPLETREELPAFTVAKANDKYSLALGKDSLAVEFFQSFPASDPIRILADAKVEVSSTSEISRKGRFRAKAERYDFFNIPLEYGGAHTGRDGGADKLNPQNLGRGSDLRKSLRAREGYFLVSADSGQIEPRVTAFISNDQTQLDVFRTGACIYMYTYATTLGVAEELLPKRGTPEGDFNRKKGKVQRLSLNYGMGGDKFARKAELDNIPFGEGRVAHYAGAHDAVRAYRRANYHTTDMWGAMERAMIALVSGAETWLGGPDGRLIHFTREDMFGKSVACMKMPGFTMYYPGLEHVRVDRRMRLRYFKLVGRNWMPQFTWGGTLMENASQCLGSCIVKEQSIAVEDAGFPILLGVHDEIVTEVRQDLILPAARYLKAALSVPPSWAPDLPLTAEVEWGLTFAGGHTYPSKEYPEL